MLLELAAFNLTMLQCSLQEQRLLTEIHFKAESNRVIDGEISSYSIKSNGDKKFVTGEDLFDLTYRSGVISGQTGDPRGAAKPFSLTRLTTNSTGPWKFEALNREGEKLEAQFDCKYRTWSPPRR